MTKDKLTSRSQMRRVAVQSPDALIAEIERLQTAERIGTRGPGLMALRRENDRLRKQLEVARADVDSHHDYEAHSFPRPDNQRSDTCTACHVLGELDRIAGGGE
jgi:hypothetical protein